MRVERGNSNGGMPSGGGMLSFSSAVPRELVHRRAVAEVFMTDIRRVGEGRYMAAAQWPRLHMFYHSVAGMYDTALIAESLRQATILVAHTMEGVPLGQAFLMPDMAVHTLDGLSRHSGAPTEVHVGLEVNVPQRNGRGPAVMRVGARFYVGGQLIATGSAGARLVEPEAYARMRLRSATDDPARRITPLPPDRVGHRFSWNVVIGESGGGDVWPLHVDDTNPILFDHPLDHVPGLLLVEAIRQAIRAQTGFPELDFLTFNVSFLKIVELNDDACVSLLSVETDLQDEGWASAEITVRGATYVQFSCRFTLNVPKEPRLQQGLSPGRSDGPGSGTRPDWLREPVPATGSTTFPQFAPAHQRGA